MDDGFLNFSRSLLMFCLWTHHHHHAIFSWMIFIIIPSFHRNHQVRLRDYHCSIVYLMSYTL
jgi:hypothetical protein